ncbi:hypothetical protein [Streptomyces sp. NBC_01589]|uniref:hypothetical protein n=1 Tax=unclassified Streptomyces TaxID=2593676 RepID=UPI00386C61C9
MVPASRSARTVEVMAQSLHQDLSRLKVQKLALERELAAVAAHLDTVRRALGALEVMMASEADATASEDPAATVQHRVTGPAPAEEDTLPAASTDMRSGGRPRRKREAPGKAGTERAYGRLTEQIMEYFARIGDTDVRARDVAVALGRGTDSGSINAVLSTLDRLVGTSRVRRSGRGLYRAR